VETEKDFDIPVAYCQECDDLGPVIIEQLGLEFGDEGLAEMPIVYCPGCENILNTHGDVEISYYSPDELEKATGWKVADGPK
jgi:hypothetical protein